MEIDLRNDHSIKSADMTEDMIANVRRVSMKGFEKFAIERDIAKYIKEQADLIYGCNWHCIVGKQFGSYVTHESKHYIYFYIGETSILLWKYG